MMGISKREARGRGYFDSMIISSLRKKPMVKVVGGELHNLDQSVASKLYMVAREVVGYNYQVSSAD